MEDIEKKIQTIEQAIDKDRPWLWQMPMTKEEWHAMRSEIEAHPYDFPLATMTWIGKWYRDNYSRECSEWPLPGVEAKKLWEVSGLDIDRFVYRTDSGLHAWQQSIYVLGGLPLCVVSASREGRLRKLLCSALAGETDQLDLIAESGDSSAALRGSIAARHSVYWYILAIVNGHRRGVHAEEKTFIDLMLEANKDSLRDKFQLEWIVTNTAGAKTFRRKLRVLFRPERNVNEGENTDTHHRYLHPQRLVALDLAPKALLSMRVRFLRGAIEVASDSVPFAIWRLASAEQGFMSWGTEPYSTVESVPTDPFDTVEILAKEDDNEEEKVVQIFTNQDCLQLFSSNRPGQWTSRRLPGRQSAAFFSQRWQLKDSIPAYTRSIGGNGRELWNWAWISSLVIIDRIDNSGSITLRNLSSREQPMTKLWSELIDYIDGGLVEVQRLEEDENGDIYPSEIERMPLIFRKSDIGILTESADIVCEKLPHTVEWKGTGSRYMEWTESNSPSFGPVKLRITTASRRTFNMEALYLPPFDTEPLIRDLDSHEIWFGDEDIMADNLDDLNSGNAVNPTIKVAYSGEGWQCLLPVWRPIRRREVLIDGKLAMTPEGDIDLPYLYHNHVTLRQWNEKGFSVFDCAALPSANSLFGVSGGALRGKWLSIANNNVSPSVPEGDFPWLKVSLGQGRATATDKDLTFLHWSLKVDERPRTIPAAGSEWNECGLSFQIGKPVDKSLRYRFPAFKQDPRHRPSWADEVASFNCAKENGTYFFIFPLLNQLKEEDVWPKLTSRLDLSSPEIQSSVRRYADEMNFDYYTITTPQDI